MAEERCSASSPCFAEEMDDAYAGYLPPDELAAAFAQLIRLAESLSPETGAKWRHALEDAARDTAIAAAPPAASGSLAEVARALLPQIRDDRLHAALTGLLRGL